jgi:DNA (cytosine-5)-methyltransferase 1
MRFVELFAGIGGFRLGLEQAGHKCVWANEILEKPRKIYARNFGHQPDPRDIRTIQPSEIPDAELLCGGFPCATFSVAGKRSGFSAEDTRGTLFFEICRILRDKRIPYIFLENVKGLLNHDGGRTFAVIISSLVELGYDIQWEVINSQNFGVPQNRERVFIVGHLRGKPRPQVFPLGRCFTEDVQEEDQAEGGEGRSTRFEAGDTILMPFVTGKVMQVKDVFPTLDGHYWKGIQNNQGRGAVMQVRAVLTPMRKEKRQNGRRVKNHNEPAFTLTAQDRHGVIVDERLRRLTPLECERLQGFPDDFTRWYDDGTEVKDAERYERCGRTVTIPVIYEISKRLPL